jgi:hypothetical protein
MVPSDFTVPPPPPEWTGVPGVPGPRPPRRGLTIAFAIITGLVVVACTSLGQALMWFIDEVVAVSPGADTPEFVWALAGWGGAIVAVTGALLLAFVPRLPWARELGRFWLVAVLFGAALGTARFVSPDYHEWYLLLLAVLALAIGAIYRPKRETQAQVDPWYAVPAGLAVLVPWVWWGSLGGAIESVLAVVAAVAVGWLAGKLPAPARTREQPPPETGRRWARLLLDGTVLGVALCALAAGIGAPGVQLLVLLTLPPVGYVLAALRFRGVLVLVALATLGPLAFADAEELSVILGDPILTALVVAAIGLGVALLVFVGYAFLRQYRRPIAWIASAALAAAAVAVYIGPGHAGLYGDRVFVIMKQQASLGGVEAIADRDQRLRGTYKRLVDTAEQSQRAIRKSLRDKRLRFTPYYLVNGLEVEGGSAVRAWLARRDDVDRVLYDPILRPSVPRDEPITGTREVPSSPQWNLTNLGADRVWNDLRVTGENIVVGSSDSGIDGAHPALRDGYRGGDDSWIDLWYDTPTPTDDIGHGTHTLGSAVGKSVGVAPDAQWIGCVNLGRNLGNPARYLGCLQFMLAPYPRGGDPVRDGRPERAPHVLTNSWGCTVWEGCDQAALRGAVDALSAAGLFVVVAAGNTGPFCDSLKDPPATYRSAFTVGSVDRNDVVSEFSSLGRPQSGKPDVVAPGQTILSSLPGGRYGFLDGTSMAAPHVAGVVALMWSANPRLIGDIDRTAEILRDTAEPARVGTEQQGECGPEATATGAGRVDAFAAVNAARGSTA